MNIKRVDVYIIGLALVQFILLFKTVSIISVGAGVFVISEQGWAGSVSMALFVGAFALAFYNLFLLVKAATASDSSEERAASQAADVARFSVAFAAVYVALELVQAISYYGAYQEF